MLKMHHILFLVIICCLTSCAPRSIREAQEVVAQADSLWHCGQMYGINDGDSATLAHSYEILGKHPFAHHPFVHRTSSLCTSYAHACYHYGRLLRAKDDPVSAMQVFINATYSHTRDYHILGRIYSNMGSICHLANKFPLSYDMYERSANYFLQNGDTLLYYYGLNNMAYELAEQGKEEETITIIDSITTNCKSKSVLAKTMETKAEAFLYSHKYDSAIHYTDNLLSNGYREPAYLLIRAQAYSFMGINDSATYYASIVLAESSKLYDRNNALYILLNNEQTQDANALLETASNRADTQKLIENKRSQCAQAVQLLEIDLERKNDLRWLYAVIGTLVIIACIIGVYVYRKHKKKELLTQKIDMLEKATNIIQERKNELSESYMAERQRKENEIKERCELFRNDNKLADTLAWNDYNAMCRIIDRQFYMLASKLQNKHILNETETRLCILVLLDLSRKEISQTLPYALNGVGKLKDHTAKKLGTTGKNLHDFLLQLAIEK